MENERQGSFEEIPVSSAQIVSFHMAIGHLNSIDLLQIPCYPNMETSYAALGLNILSFVIARWGLNMEDIKVLQYVRD